MGEAKRRKDLGLTPREDQRFNKKSNTTIINQTLNKYPYLPIIVGLAMIAILIFDLINYYK